MANDVLPLWRDERESTGREAELSLLVRELEEVRRSGESRFVFVRGGPGMGKSHLFALLRREMQASHAKVFEGDSGREQKRAFGLFAPVVRGLHELVRHQGADGQKRAQLAERTAALLARPSERADAEPDRVALFDAAAELLSLAAREPIVVLLPDLDAADGDSVELFRYVAAVFSAPGHAARVLFCASFRDGVLPEALQQSVDRLSARTVSLSGLNLDGIRAFLARKDLAERLLEASGGSPQALEDILERPARPAPDFAAKRAERLRPEARQLLSLLSLSDGALSAAELTGASGRLSATSNAPLVTAALDSLLRERFVAVRLENGEPRYRLLREADRTALSNALSGGEAEALRAAVGAELEARGELRAAAELFLLAEPERGAQLSLRAAQVALSRAAHEDAVALLTRALPLLSRPDRNVAHAALSRAFAGQGEFRLSFRHWSRARGENPSERRLEGARLLLKVGRPARAAALLSGMRSETDARVSLRANALLAEVELLRGRPQEAIAVASAVLAQGPDAALSISLRNALGRAHLLRGEYAEADVAFSRNLEVAQANGLTTAAGDALLNQGVVAHKRGERDRAIALYQGGLPSAERVLKAKALANLGSIFADGGEFELAVDHLSRAMGAFSRLGSGREVAHAASNLSRLYLFLGDMGRAAELSEYALSRAKEIGEKYLEASATLNQGGVLLDRREFQEAARVLGEAKAGFAATGTHGFFAYAAALKAKAHLSSGERSQAHAELSAPDVERGAAAMAAAAVEVWLCRAEVALAMGDLLTAGRAASRAKDALLQEPELEGPYRVYFLMGRLKLAAHDVSGAQAEFARAGRLLEELSVRVSAVRRKEFLSVPRRAEVLAVQEPELKLPRVSLPKAVTAASTIQGLIGQSQALGKIAKQLVPVGRSNATVLLRGESGTGKEVVAEALHDLSTRRAMPLVKVNCAAMVEDLLLSELFGHEKGAFTGAVRERKGRFELADGGTLFLDEIGDISPKCQVALLRVLQEREFERVGGTKTLKVDVRVICATNRDLETLIAQGRFRQDLYYRLKGVTLELPALRERLDDLPLLASHFLERIAEERGEEPKHLAPDAVELLSRHTWPGNVRELENVIASASIFAEGEMITSEAFEHVAELSALRDAPRPAGTSPAPAAILPPSARVEPEHEAPLLPATALLSNAAAANGNPSQVVDYYALVRSGGISLKDLRQQVELQCIARALEEAQGNISEAARLLGMKRSRLSQIVNAEPSLKELAHGE